MAGNRRYYWLKLQKDFFKRHDIKIIEAMPNGKDYVLFYLKLLVESISHDGSLRFSDTVPYNEDMLSVITSTNVDVVRSAMKVFTELQMINVLDDQTIFMAESDAMLGCETAWAEKKRLYRQKEDNVPRLSESCLLDVRQEKELELEKEIDIESRDKRGKAKRFSPPSLDEIRSECLANGYIVNPAVFFDHYQSNGWVVGKAKMKDWKSALRNWNRRDGGEKASKPKKYKTIELDGEMVDVLDE